MILIQQISATKHFSADRFYRTLYESLLDPRLITTSKHILYLNLLYRALKADTSIRRVKAFVKRLLQIINLHEPPFICGVLYLIKELIGTFPSIKTMLTAPEDNASDSEDEHIEDATKVDTNGQAASKHPQYDPRKRDPDYAHADLSSLWELLPLQAHYHPSVSVLASKILKQEPIKEKPDPTIYTLMSFLDKFSFRNAKTKTQVVHGTSIMQPMANTTKAADYLITARGGDRLHDPVNSEQFWKKKVDSVREDEVFFHTYFEKAGKAKQVNKKEKKKRKGEDDDEDEDESAGEDEVWKALVHSRPEIEGDEEDDSGFSDFDMDDMSDDDDDAENDADADMDGGVELNLDSDDEDEEPTAKAGTHQDDDNMGDEGFDFDDEDEEAFVDSDGDVPFDVEAADDESKTDQKKNKKRKLKHLPTFASAEDYAKLIGDDDEDV
jgi:ribosome biogenesis protein MAK21